MPLPIYLAHKLTRRQSEMRKNGGISWLRPDAKSQVTIEYSRGKPKRIDTVLISTQHAPDVSQAEIVETVTEQIIMPSLPEDMVDNDIKVFVNPTGRFVVGGPMGDAGVTGRKIIVDTYGGMGRHGGGAFSGKDPTKVDRSAAYAARYVAKNIVAAEVTVGGGLLIDRLAQAQVTDDRAGAQVEVLGDERGDLFIRDFRCTKGLHIH